jgi:hypothetical protein
LLKIKMAKQEAKENRDRRIDALLESASVRSAQGGEMSDSGKTVGYICKGCEHWVTGDHSLGDCLRSKEMTPKPENPAKTDAINHPQHYGGDTPYEAIKVIEAWGLGFCLGNVVKYISRAGKKTPDLLVDLKKSAWYLNREIERLEKE